MTMTTHRYTLEKYKTKASRYTCPQCNQPHKLTRYIDGATGTHIDDHVGKCDREESCGYHFTPKNFFDSIPDYKPTKMNLPQVNPQIVKHSTVAKKLFNKSLGKYRRNDFVEYLESLFDIQTVEKLVDDYYIGTAKHWPHATIFWQVDRKDDVRTGKIMLYDPYTGKRVKQPYAHITWVHTLLKDAKFNLKQCLFGEHLVAPGSKKPVAVVESEKTAIIGAGFMPEYIWVATGSLEGLTYDKCRVLHGREVIFFPDADAYPKWEAKLKQLKIKLPGTRLSIADYLKDIPEADRTKGMDVADWLTDVRASKVLEE
jgi:hypothetical protein